MRVAVAVAQTPVTWDISQNLAAITSCLAGARPGEIVLLPEACLSGYDDRLSGLDQLDPDTLARGVDRLAGLAMDQGIHLFCGSLLFQDGAWWNAALYLAPDGTRWTYRKVNLATHERGRLAAGTELPVLQLRLDGGSLAVGVQLCREIVFPEQWRYLAEAGAQAFLYLTNAVNPAVPAGVWSSHLISHAAVNQRFVLACNVADPGQHCPSMIVSPRGEILGDVSIHGVTVPGLTARAVPASRAGWVRSCSLRGSCRPTASGRAIDASARESQGVARCNAAV